MSYDLPTKKTPKSETMEVAFAIPEKTGLPPLSSPTVASKSAPRFVPYDNKRIHMVSQLDRLDRETREGMLRASQVFPVRVNSYVLENLIDWESAPNDPMYRLLFPHPDMLTATASEQLDVLAAGNFESDEVKKRLRAIRDQMNPHPAGQTTNVPTLDQGLLEGVQHKYRETALYFPKQGQTCHSYCTFCFRWPQFVETSAPKFESNDLKSLRCYLRDSPQISDLLLTGGDPMVMNSRRLGQLFDLLHLPELDHVKTIRIGTKALSYWPYRFFADSDSQALLDHMKRLVDAGKQVAIMAHINHWREMQTEAFEEAVSAIRSTGAIIRSQAPILRHVNDDADVWAKNWRMQNSMGIQPYYMFLERDTGAVHYFSVPLVKVHAIYKAAVSQVSGLCRTARGPVMSAEPGKVQVLGPIDVGGQKALALTMLQGRNPDWVNTPFLAKYSDTAVWIDDLEPFDPAHPFPFKT
ncbi:MAG: hypothetical protein ABJO27_26505 [Pseudoruegeria sp.]